jgi:MutS domain V
MTPRSDVISQAARMDAIADAHRSRVAASSTSASMDDRTWADLNMDAVFAALDRTESTLGQHALYHRLRTTPAADHLAAFEALVERMTIDVPARERARRALGRLRDPHGYDLWWLAQQDALETRSWYVVFPFLAATTIVQLLLLLTPWWPRIVPLLVVTLVTNLVVRFSTDRRVFTLATAFRQLAPVIATAQALRFLSGADIELIGGPLQSEVPKLAPLKTIARWVSGDPLMLSIMPSPLAVILSDFSNVIYEYLNLAFLLDANGVYFGARALQAHGASLLRTIAAMGDVDAAISVAAFRASAGVWTRPRRAPAGTPAVLTDVRHPLVDAAVANTITLAPGHGALITGSNMSGKSTFLRTVGVAAVMAQTIHTCLAAEYEAPVFNVRSCIGRADDLLAGKSYYIVEVESLLELVQASSTPAPHLFLLDELFRGTNAVERIAAGQAVLEALLVGESGRTPHVVLAATHDGELVDLLPRAYAAYHFGDTVGREGLEFDHRLQPGPATTRNAITLLRLHGAPKRLVDRATECAATLDRQRGITSA